MKGVKMTKKAFTLVELLGVITVLGIIGLITIPVVNNTIKSSKQRAYDAQVKEILKAAEDYLADHLDELEDGSILCEKSSYTNINITYISVRKLQVDGYIPESIKDPRTNEELDYNDTVEINYDCDYKSYNYKYVE